MNTYSNHYYNNQVMTASPEQILIMLYDGAIRFVRQAKFAIEDNRKADKAIAIGKAVAIITEFSNTLNYEIGGEIAHDLNRLYDFMVRELSAINVNGDANRLLPVENILIDLREGFSGAAEANRHSAQTLAGVDPAEKRIAASF